MSVDEVHPLTIWDLPDETLTQIFGYLSVQELDRVRHTCGWFDRVADDLIEKYFDWRGKDDMYKSRKDVFVEGPERKIEDATEISRRECVRYARMRHDVLSKFPSIYAIVASVPPQDPLLINEDGMTVPEVPMCVQNMNRYGGFYCPRSTPAAVQMENFTSFDQMMFECYQHTVEYSIREYATKIAKLEADEFLPESERVTGPPTINYYKYDSEKMAVVTETYDFTQDIIEGPLTGLFRFNRPITYEEAIDAQILMALLKD